MILQATDQDGRGMMCLVIVSLESRSYRQQGRTGDGYLDGTTIRDPLYQSQQVDLVFPETDVHVVRSDLVYSDGTARKDGEEESLAKVLVGCEAEDVGFEGGSGSGHDGGVGDVSGSRRDRDRASSQI
jgi:hypothetical protein